MLYLSLVEDGDIIAVDNSEASVNVNATKYYIKRDGGLVEVPWYQASEYQEPYRDQIRKKMKR